MKQSEELVQEYMPTLICLLEIQLPHIGIGQSSRNIKKFCSMSTDGVVYSLYFSRAEKEDSISSREVHVLIGDSDHVTPLSH